MFHPNQKFFDGYHAKGGGLSSAHTLSRQFGLSRWRRLKTEKHDFQQLSYDTDSGKLVELSIETGSYQIPLP
jgi:hypothetical protein